MPSEPQAGLTAKRQLRLAGAYRHVLLRNLSLIKQLTGQPSKPIRIDHNTNVTLRPCRRGVNCLQVLERCVSESTFVIQKYSLFSA